MHNTHNASERARYFHEIFSKLYEDLSTNCSIRQAIGEIRTGELVEMLDRLEPANVDFDGRVWLGKAAMAAGKIGVACLEKGQQYRIDASLVDSLLDEQRRIMMENDLILEMLAFYNIDTDDPDAVTSFLNTIADGQCTDGSWSHRLGGITVEKTLTSRAYDDRMSKQVVAKLAWRPTIILRMAHDAPIHLPQAILTHESRHAVQAMAIEVRQFAINGPVPLQPYVQFMHGNDEFEAYHDSGKYLAEKLKEHGKDFDTGPYAADLVIEEVRQRNESGGSFHRFDPNPGNMQELAQLGLLDEIQKGY